MRSLPRLVRDAGRRLLGRGTDHRSIFTRIYRHNSWGSAESVSGPGSTRERGADFRDDLVALLRRLDARVLLDAPCGDFNWMAEVVESVDEYVGVDVVRELIARNVRRYAAPGRRFACADVTADPLPRADVILCRDCLVHFSFADAWAALANFRRTGSRWLLATTFVERESNEDIRTGGWRTLNLQAAPFRFPPPVSVIDERCLHTGGIYRDKRLALWALDSLPAGPAPS
ncbi:MAG TPA: class I SAM-dependent methyltransferase [Longimicrobium sp.]|nr:class I SAM-dependent methyltransferase [Longimicrobium sp.]